LQEYHRKYPWAVELKEKNASGFILRQQVRWPVTRNPLHIGAVGGKETLPNEVPIKGHAARARLLTMGIDCTAPGGEIESFTRGFRVIDLPLEFHLLIAAACAAPAKFLPGSRRGFGRYILPGSTIIRLFFC
jgi:hypothetical protein